MDVENPKKKEERLQSEINKLDEEIKEYKFRINEGHNEFQNKMKDIKDYSERPKQAELAGTQESLYPPKSRIKDKNKIHRLTFFQKQKDLDEDNKPWNQERRDEIALQASKDLWNNVSSQNLDEIITPFDFKQYVSVKDIWWYISPIKTFMDSVKEELSENSQGLEDLIEHEMTDSPTDVENFLLLLRQIIYSQLGIPGIDVTS